jgi:hypothetical protein
MKIGKWTLALVLVLGFVGGTFASLLTRPVLAQGEGYSAPQIFLDGKKLVPKDGQIHINIHSFGPSSSYFMNSDVSDGYVDINFWPPVETPK